LRLWIDSAHQSFGHAQDKSLIRAGAAVRGDTTSTFQNKEQFFAIVASCSQSDPIQGKASTALIAQRAATMLEGGTPLEAVVETLLPTLSEGEHAPFSILQVLEGSHAHVVECDAPPLFLTRGGERVLLPVVEDVSHGRLVRECRFSLQDGDHIAMVSEGYIHARGWVRRWGWRDIATSIKRLTDTRCDAEQLLGALIRSYHRLAEGEATRDISVVAMCARPMRLATVWSGPPVDRSMDKVVLEKFMDGPGARIICGGSTAEIAARLLGTELTLEPRPKAGWMEVPPTSRLEGVDLVTEGLVTLSKARERIAEARRARDLPRSEDGATRLAQMLLKADSLHFLVGLAVNPIQASDAAGTIPLRQVVIGDLMRDLEARGKIVSAEYFGGVQNHS